MNMAANVTYHGFIVYPEVKVGLWAAGKTPTIQFKKDEEVYKNAQEANEDAKSFTIILSSKSI
jgi:hypothetical protein